MEELLAEKERLISRKEAQHLLSLMGYKHYCHYLLPVYPKSSINPKNYQRL
jgi:hypothetical protein